MEVLPTDPCPGRRQHPSHFGNDHTEYPPLCKQWKMFLTITSQRSFVAGGVTPTFPNAIDQAVSLGYTSERLFEFLHILSN